MKNHIALFLGLILGTVSTLSFAALPLAVATGFTEISTNLQGVFDLALPVVILGVVLTLVLKLLKRFSNKV